MTSTPLGPALVLSLAATVVAGLQAGTYFTWATGVMPGLARVDDRTFVATMQQVNVAIVNPIFLATFAAPPLLAGAVAVLGTGPARPWAIAATVLAVGTVAITVAGNVPLNDALAAAGRLDAIAELAAVRADFESRWVALNIARCLTSAGALACLAVAALRLRG
ncbi:DUF1772 domain-containing protein [Nocardioides sp. zg-1228]|uniref:anthrone oxygenase family protein n=1 Tax=Nocardioides sp. zg-1228 TaxID=2763008 RepID=UPI0016427B6A|nr:anthrone oxygenase family protein [Nocardioides sp. zg-1228]MBC2933791.1 DUF1772 domain-containing protein [Nocardioides sp. zg-1228]QSF58567.1 DUF1772 domain-containing protein [Nocardioides sp. zg-1228]